MTYNPFDIVVVPFPFTDRMAEKRRPALVLSNSEKFSKPTEHYVLAMITSKNNPSWPLDTVITHKKMTGLDAPSKVRMKLFTLDHRLIIKKIGSLSAEDRVAVAKRLRDLMPV